MYETRAIKEITYWIQRFSWLDWYELDVLLYSKDKKIEMFCMRHVLY